MSAVELSNCEELTMTNRWIIKCFILIFAGFTADGNKELAFNAFGSVLGCRPFLHFPGIFCTTEISGNDAMDFAQDISIHIYLNSSFAVAAASRLFHMHLRLSHNILAHAKDWWQIMGNKTQPMFTWHNPIEEMLFHNVRL